MAITTSVINPCTEPVHFRDIRDIILLEVLNIERVKLTQPGGFLALK